MLRTEISPSSSTSLVFIFPVISPVMSLFKILVLAASLTSLVSAFDPQLDFNSFVEVENRTLDELYQAALTEGGMVTV